MKWNESLVPHVFFPPMSFLSVDGMFFFLNLKAQDKTSNHQFRRSPTSFLRSNLFAHQRKPGKERETKAGPTIIHPKVPESELI